MNDVAKNILLWAVIAVILLSVFSNFSKQSTTQAPLSYSTFIQMVKSGEVSQVTIDGRDIKGKLGTGNVFATYSPETDNRALVGDLLEHGVDIKGVPPESQSLLMQIFISWFPFLLADRYLDILHAPDARWWRWPWCDVIRQEQGAHAG